MIPLFALPFPPIEPVLLSVGPIKIYWYGISYFLGIILGWKYALWLCQRYRPDLKTHADRFFYWVFIAVVLGGRLGHVFFYEFDYYTQHPLEILMTWKGGMSFHGGCIAVILATISYCVIYKIRMFRLGDLVASCVTIGLFFGRIANFINAELLGRPTDLPWGVFFPNGGDVPRHPTQLYEAFSEGFILFVMMHWLWKKAFFNTFDGKFCGFFLFVYGSFRFVIEFLKEPDQHIGYFLNVLTLGHLLCIPMIVVGLIFIVFARKAIEDSQVA